MRAVGIPWLQQREEEERRWLEGGDGAEGGGEGDLAGERERGG